VLEVLQISRCDVVAIGLALNDPRSLERLFMRCYVRTQLNRHKKGNCRTCLKDEGSGQITQDTAGHEHSIETMTKSLALVLLENLLNRNIERAEKV